MKADEAPLYVHAYDLAVWVFERAARFPRNHRAVLASRLEGAAFDLLEAITLALRSRARRQARIDAADESLTRLRLASRLARDLGVLQPRQNDHLALRADEIGRMLGGWRRQVTGASPPRTPQGRA